MPAHAWKESIEETSQILKKAFADHPTPGLAIVGGSGLGSLAESGRTLASVSFADLPAIGQGSVEGHAGTWSLVELNGVQVFFLAGRRHFYEGIAHEQPAMAMRLLAALDVKRVILTNAAGGLVSRLRVGDLMLLNDHMNLMFRNPLTGTGEVAQAERTRRSPTAPYSAQMQTALRTAALKAGVALREGVYLGLSGPSYETRAEVRAFQTIGADAVGMSTVPEALVAAELGMEVAAISLITNSHALAGAEPPTHEEVLEAGRDAAERLGNLLCAVLPELV